MMRYLYRRIQLKSKLNRRYVNINELPKLNFEIPRYYLIR